MILLRHGQSEFNVHFSVTRVDPGIVDPRLTELGHQQAAEAAAALKAEPIRQIIASPYWRALETAAPIADALGLKVQVSRLVCERYAYACDVGSPRSALGEAWPQHDFSVIDEVWWPPFWCCGCAASWASGRASSGRPRRCRRRRWAPRPAG
jgi:broad specificity phosphatase PhoE